jgi:hypothetical protein
VLDDEDDDEDDGNPFTSVFSERNAPKMFKSQVFDWFLEEEESVEN